VFTDDGLAEIARVAFEANTRLENIGARRLHTVLETVLEEISFRAPERRGETFTVDAALVQAQLGEVLADEDLGRYIL
ncbi:MAG: ATP-dependent HslUV protease ATP-binding subunit HslU, partial [Bradymonadia bacterium]